MDHIPFEKISLTDAIEALKEKPASNKGLDWRALRGKPTGLTNQLDQEARTWLGSLPKDVRPNWLTKEYPRIINKMASLAHRPRFLEMYLNELALDQRGGRSGFPVSVALEIGSLKNHLFDQSPGSSVDIWGHK